MWGKKKGSTPVPTPCHKVVQVKWAPTVYLSSVTLHVLYQFLIAPKRHILPFKYTLWEMNQALSIVEGAESPGQKQEICESLWINISQSTFHKTLVSWEIHRLQRKEYCGQISLGKPRLNKVHLFSLLLGFLVFSVLEYTIKLQAQGMIKTISQVYLMKEPFCSSKHFSGLVINKLIH